MLFARIVSLTLVATAVVSGAWVVRQAMQYPDAAPMGALCMGVPSMVLLVIAGEIWPTRK
jgi:hypothetical protein